MCKGHVNEQQRAEVTDPYDCLLGSEETEIIVLGLCSSDRPIQLYVTGTSGISFRCNQGK